MLVVTIRAESVCVSAIRSVLGFPRTNRATVVESSQAKYPTGLMSLRTGVGGVPLSGKRQRRWAESRSTRTTEIALPSGVSVAEYSLSGVDVTWTCRAFSNL